MTKEELIQLRENNSKTFVGTLKAHYQEDLKKILEYNIKNNLIYYSISQALYNYVYDITELPKCKTCGKEIFSFGGNKKWKYQDFCSNKCLSNNPEIMLKKAESHKKLNRSFKQQLIDKEKNIINSNHEIYNKSYLKLSINDILKEQKYDYRNLRSIIINKHPIIIKSLFHYYNYDKYSFNEAIYLLLNDKSRPKCLICSKDLKYKAGGYPQYCNKHKNHASSSKLEKEIYEYIKNDLKIKNIIRNTKLIISPKEIDIYLSDYKIGIEFDGIWYHSELAGTEKKYHLMKTDMCESKGIQLFHIFENEWIYKQDIVKSILRAKLGKLDNKVYARKCIIKEVETKEKTKFLNSNHIQGACGSRINLGLYYEDELVSLMTFGSRKISGVVHFELLRFCNKLNTSVVGGSSRLFKYFISNYEYDKIISYADRRYSNGNMYNVLGFKLSHKSGPNYWYFEKDYILRHRSRYQKHKLGDVLSNFDDGLSEFENMVNNGWNRIWDCGNLVYEYEN